METLQAWRLDQELPVWPLHWYDDDRTNPAAFATGWTATVKVALATAPHTILLTKTVGITLADTFPNYTIAWSAADFTTLGASVTSDVAGTRFVLYAYNRRNSDSLDDLFARGDEPIFRLYPTPAP